jgi:DNA-directed RNA polymerase subunit RPC12/RpoP
MVIRMAGYVEKHPPKESCPLIVCVKPDGDCKTCKVLHKRDEMERNLKLMFKCPKCGEKFEVKEPSLGEIMTMECPHCHAHGDFLDAPNTVYRTSGILRDGRIVRQEQKEDEVHENNQERQD